MRGGAASAAAVEHLIGRMMARRVEDRYQDVGVILEDLASYERRGLLKYPDSGFYIPVPANRSDTGDTTRSYQVQQEAPDDVVI